MFSFKECQKMTRDFIRFHPEAMLCTDQEVYDACTVSFLTFLKKSSTEDYFFRVTLEG